MASFEEILSILPRLECGHCGYNGCEPYAKAIAANQTSIDRCTPGGIRTLAEIAQITSTEINSYTSDMLARAEPTYIAKIDPMSCIGCFKCAEICPVDAIIGDKGLLHEIIDTECNGCGLCINICPTDCIELKEHNSIRYELRNYYAERQKNKKERNQNKTNPSFLGISSRKSYILKAQQRVKDAKSSKDNLS